ncbi:MAG: choice-of-anchor H family protein [Colwellia sp.]|nr:choice-of-anchor H family protein [Colwellia sp.]
MSITNQTVRFIKHSFSYSVIGISLLLPLFAISAVSAELNNNDKDNDNGSESLVTVSVGMKKELSASQATTNYRQQNILLTKNKSIASVSSKVVTRESKKKAAQNTAIKYKAKSLLKTSNFHHSFSIYNAESYLLDDYDGDGYYQTFSVVFDADLHSAYADDIAEVYADMYLSKNGGPWIYYYTTDSFIIEGDSDLDEYEVITTLHQGYASDTYDVLIDLYEVGFEQLVASYSSDDNNALYALPLESSEIDIEYIVEVYDDYAGSMSALFLFLVLMVLGLRLRLKKCSELSTSY